MPKRFIKQSKKASIQPAGIIGRVIEGEVRDVINNGAGVIATESGLTVFVWGVWLGETVRVKITSLKKRIAEGQLQEVLLASAARREVRCQYAKADGKESKAFGSKAQCGGCLWQHVDYSAQIEQKQRWVQQAFGAFTDKILPCRPSASEWEYRNRAEFKSDGKKLGYVARQSHELVDVDLCPVLNRENQTHLTSLREKLPNNAWQKRQIKGKASYTLLAVDDELEGDVIANQRRPFKQGNTEQNLFMRAWLSERLAKLPTVYHVAELFCGSGNFTEVISQRPFACINATEGDKNSLAFLAAKKLPNVVTQVVNAFDEQAFGEYIKGISPFDVLVLDPPRDGLKVIAPVLEQPSLKHIFYISCDLATCRRDVERFCEAGFEIDEVQPLDQFPQTPHLELCVALTRA